MSNDIGEVFATAFVTAYKEWDESKHPRDPAGTSEGGEFTAAGGENTRTDVPKTAEPTLQEQLKAKMQSLKIPYHDIQVYGSQITVETRSEAAMRKWLGVVRRFATVGKVIKTSVPAKSNKRGQHILQYVDVWRLYATT